MADTVAKPEAPQPDAGSATAPSIRISGARKYFTREDGTTVHAVDGIDLEVVAGEFVVLLGPSGCGKTTLLRSIAGLEELTEGSVEVQGRVLFDKERKINVAPEKRNVGMMFQSYALWPHMSVAKNVAYPLVSQKFPRPEIARRVDSILETVGIADLRSQFPSQISGGQQQRVALARALVSGHGVVLFDEPLSNVDARVRDHLRVELKRLHDEFGFTAVYVTHDQDEALALATTVVVLEKGRIAQAAAPREVYTQPETAYVARFMGAANEIAGTVTASSDGGTVIDTAIGSITGVSPRPVAVGDQVVAFVRPERWIVTASGSGTNTWAGALVNETFHGFYSDLEYDLGGEIARVRQFSVETETLASPALHVEPVDVRIIPARDVASAASVES